MTPHKQHRQQPTISSIALLAQYLGPQASAVALLTALLLGSLGLQLVAPQIVRAFIDGVRSGMTAAQLVPAGLLFLGANLLSQVLTVAVTFLGENVGWRATNAVRADLLRHCLALDVTFHHARTPGELIERIDGDVTTLANFFSRFVILIVGSILLLAGVLVLLFREDVRVGVVMTLYVLATLFILLRVRDWAVPAWRADRQASATVYGFIEERLLGLADLHASGAQSYVLRRFFEQARHRYHVGRRAWMLGSLTRVTANLLFTGGYFTAFAIGIALFREGALTVGAVYLVYYYAWMLRRPLEQLTRELQDFQKAAAGIGRVAELRRLTSRLEPPAPTVARRLPDGPLDVELDSVTFAYPVVIPMANRTDAALSGDAAVPANSPDGEPRTSSADVRQGPDAVLHNVSFRIEPGRTLGVLGRTGSGKTSLTRLLFRLYDVNAGSVRVGGVDVRHAAPGELARRVGLVTQEVQLFAASVRDNLTLFDRGVPDAHLFAVIDELGLTPWLRTLPDGLKTHIAAGGLSAGEAQLLALTRVFLRDPGLVIMDEASSRLDPATERLLEGALQRLLHGRTVLLIAHRLATVQRADDVLVLDAGRVVEHGPREALAADPASRFSHLVRAAALDGARRLPDGQLMKQDLLA